MKKSIISIVAVLLMASILSFFPEKINDQTPFKGNVAEAKSVKKGFVRYKYIIKDNGVTRTTIHNDIYLNKSEAKNYAVKLKGSAKSALLAIAVGFIPKVGVWASVYTGLTAAASAYHADKIMKVAKKNKGVHIRTTNSGSVEKVTAWNRSSKTVKNSLKSYSQPGLSAKVKILGKKTK